jgi:hypothetical protein
MRNFPRFAQVQVCRELFEGRIAKATSLMLSRTTKEDTAVMWDVKPLVTWEKRDCGA